jgi:predicted aspartyl protease
MIIGVVTAFRQATIRLSVRDSTGQEHALEAVIDTGFDGALTLPPTLIAALGLPWRRRGRARLADGNESLFDVYEATVLRSLPANNMTSSPLYRDSGLVQQSLEQTSV